MPFTHTRGARIYWKHDGRDEAAPLVLLNSIGTDMDLWEPVLPYLRERFTILRIDARGHGASLAEAGDYSLTMLADDVLAVADDAGFARFALAGVSLGGMIGMELAIRAPERIARLALICTSATMDSGAWNDRVVKVRDEGMPAIASLAMGRFLSDAAAPAIYEAVRRQLLTTNPDGYAGCGAAIRDMDLADRIGSIACPTLVVTGSRDTSTPFEGHGDFLANGIPGAAHQMLETAHLAPLETPAELASALRCFLAR